MKVKITIPKGYRKLTNPKDIVKRGDLVRCLLGGRSVWEPAQSLIGMTIKELREGCPWIACRPKS